MVTQILDIEIVFNYLQIAIMLIPLRWPVGV